MDTTIETDIITDASIYLTSKGVTKWTIAVTVVVILLALCGMFLNSLVLLCISLARKLQVTSSFFIANLNASGVILCGVVFPLYILDVNDGSPGRGTTTYCMVHSITCRVCITQILISIAQISYNRYVLMAKSKAVYEKRYNCHRSLFLIATSWVLAAILVGCPLISSHSFIAYSPEIGYCDFGSSNLVVPYLSLTVFLVCLCLVARCYIKVYRHLRSEMSRLKEIPNSQQIKSKRVRYKATKNMFLLTVTYSTCCFPHFIVQVLRTHFDVPFQIHLVTNMMLYATPVLNPILYACRNKMYWIAMKAVLSCKMPDRQLRESLKRIEERKRAELLRRSQCQRISQSQETGFSGALASACTGALASGALGPQVGGGHSTLGEELSISVTLLENQYIKPRTDPITVSREKGCLIQQDSVIVSTRMRLSSWPNPDDIQDFSTTESDTGDHKRGKQSKSIKQDRCSSTPVLLRAHCRYGSYYC